MFIEILNVWCFADNENVHSFEGEKLLDVKM